MSPAFLWGELWDCLESLALNGNYGFCIQELTFYLQKSFSLCSLLARTQTKLRLVGFFKTPNLTHNKIPDNKSHRVFYGASSGTRHEPTYAELAQMCLHETEVISDIEKWCA